MNARRWVSALIAVFWCGTVGAAEPVPTTAPTGTRQRVTFTEPSPVGGIEEYCRRTRQSVAAYKKESADYEYTLADESFELLVPASYQPDGSHGLLVWISPGRADLPKDWFAVLERHKLIWISPNNAGNPRHFITRISLALDAAHNIKATYKLDPARIYVAGFSGGGRVSSMVVLAYPDIFTGAVCMMGSNFYRMLPAGDGKYFRPTASKPLDPLFAQAKRLPIVLMTGQTDGNQPQTKANYEAFQKDRFAHVTYIEVPGIGHNMPDPSWLEKALTDLDANAVAPMSPTSRPAARSTTPRTTGQRITN